MGCKTSKDSENHLQEANNMPKFQFETEKELLDSAAVKALVDDLTTKSEQAIDDLKKTVSEQEKKFKAIVIDAIITASVKLNKHLIKDLSSADETVAKKAREDLITKLSARTFDSLNDSLNDLNLEVAAMPEKTKEDPSQKAVEDALKDKEIPSTTPAAAPAAKVEDSAPAAAPETLNQAGKVDSDKEQVTNLFNSFTKPVK
jgi:hypothetical protein